jgi:hypothetical protein
VRHRRLRQQALGGDAQRRQQSVHTADVGRFKRCGRHVLPQQIHARWLMPVQDWHSSTQASFWLGDGFGRDRRVRRLCLRGVTTMSPLQARVYEYHRLSHRHRMAGLQQATPARTQAYSGITVDGDCSLLMLTRFLGFDCGLMPSGLCGGTFQPVFLKPQVRCDRTHQAEQHAEPRQPEKGASAVK